MGIDFFHSIIERHHLKNQQVLPDWIKQYKNNDLKVSCLFGGHLLNKYRYPIARWQKLLKRLYMAPCILAPDDETNIL